jgi:hypothetical protein
VQVSLGPITAVCGTPTASFLLRFFLLLGLLLTDRSLRFGSEEAADIGRHFAVFAGGVEMRSEFTMEKLLRLVEKAFSVVDGQSEAHQILISMMYATSTRNRD